MAGHLSAALVLLALAGPQSPEPATPSLPDTIRTGMTVTVVDEGGVVREGRVDGVTGSALRLTRSGRIYEIAVDDIVRIEKSDSLRNGALTGLALGMLFGALPPLITEPPGGERTKFLVGSIIGNSIIWTALGTGVDAMVNSKRTLYERGRRRTVSVSPVMGRSRAGASVQVRW
jgi:hypothetical protein